MGINVTHAFHKWSTLCKSSEELLFEMLELFSECEFSCIHPQIFELYMLLCIVIWCCNIFWTLWDGRCIICLVMLISYWIMFSLSPKNVMKMCLMKLGFWYKMMLKYFTGRIVVLNFIITDDYYWWHPLGGCYSHFVSLTPVMS